MSAASRSARTIQVVLAPIVYGNSDVSCAPELSIPKYDPSKSCAPLVIDRTRKFSRSESPPQITTPTPLESPTQHPDMLAMLQGLDAEFLNWIQDSTYLEGDLGELDAHTDVCSTAPVQAPHALECFGDISGSSPSQPVARPLEGYCSPPRESRSLAADTLVIQQPSTPNVSESPPPRVSPPPSGRISFKELFKKSCSNTVSAQTNPSYHPHRRLWSHLRLLAVT